MSPIGAAISHSVAPARRFRHRTVVALSGPVTALMWAGIMAGARMM